MSSGWTVWKSAHLVSAPPQADDITGHKCWWTKAFRKGTLDLYASSELLTLLLPPSLRSFKTFLPVSRLPTGTYKVAMKFGGGDLKLLHNHFIQNHTSIHLVLILLFNSWNCSINDVLDGSLSPSKLELTQPTFLTCVYQKLILKNNPKRIFSRIVYFSQESFWKWLTNRVIFERSLAQRQIKRFLNHTT